MEGAREKAELGKLAFGTIDTFLIWRLTGGVNHLTDATNASRTNLFNIHSLKWDDTLLELFRVPKQILPEVKECTADFGSYRSEAIDYEIPIQGVAGDQQAATVGQCCFSEGSIKSTYGTGCFVMINTGQRALSSQNRLLTTIAYQIRGETYYALEGAIFIAGAAIQWLRDGLNLIESAAETESMATGLEDNGGVYMVPAFTGLGAPWWQPEARGSIYGITRDTRPEHFVRAALEAAAYQSLDLFDAMTKDGIKPTQLRVDGGMITNDWLQQFLSDILELPVERPKCLESTALGAAFLAGLQAGIYKSPDQLSQYWHEDKTTTPNLPEEKRKKLISKWQQAVRSTLGQGKNGLE